jgi:excisionase family DNA binding protein
MDTTMRQEWYTLDEVATILRVTKRHVERLIKSGVLESRKFSPRVRRVSREAIESYVEGAPS